MVLKNLHIKENEKKLGIIFGVFFGVASWIFVIINLSMMPKIK
jgi:hypothetical protein